MGGRNEDGNDVEKKVVCFVEVPSYALSIERNITNPNKVTMEKSSSSRSSTTDCLRFSSPH